MRQLQRPVRTIIAAAVAGLTAWTASPIRTAAQNIPTTTGSSPIIDFPIEPEIDTFVKVGGTGGQLRASAHIDFADGVRAYAVVSESWSIPNTLTMEREAKALPYLDGTHGLTIGVTDSRYTSFVAPIYLVFDFSRGECFRTLELSDPRSHFLLPMSGYFNPFVAAKLHGIPFEQLLRNDVGVALTVVDAQGKTGVQVYPAIATGCAGLVVSEVLQHGTYVPVVFDRPNAPRSPRVGQTGIGPSGLIQVLTTQAASDVERERARAALFQHITDSAASGSVRPSRALAAAAIASLWSDPGLPAVRARMFASLFEDIEYWSGDERQASYIHDLTAAAIVLAGPGTLAGPWTPHLSRLSKGWASEDDPMTARDYFAAGLIAALMGDVALAEKQNARARDMFKIEISEMLTVHQTMSSLYEAVAWGKMIGANRNPQRYRRLVGDYKDARWRYRRCMIRWQRPPLREYRPRGLKNFGVQEEHTATTRVSLVETCGTKPQPPKRAKDDKPERDDLKKTREGLGRWKRVSGLPKKFDTIFNTKVPTSVSYRDVVPKPGPFAVPQAVFEQLLSETISVWERVIEGLEQDPPRFDFQEFAEPVAKPLPAAIFEGGYFGDDAREFLTAFQHAAAVMQAAVVTYDRLGGAEQTPGAETSALLQQIQLEMLKYDAGEAILEVVRILDERRSFLLAFNPVDPEHRLRSHGDISEPDLDFLDEFASLLRPLGEMLVQSY